MLAVAGNLRDVTLFYTYNRNFIFVHYLIISTSSLRSVHGLTQVSVTPMPPKGSGGIAGELYQCHYDDYYYRSNSSNRAKSDGKGAQDLGGKGTRRTTLKMQ